MKCIYYCPQEHVKENLKTCRGSEEWVVSVIKLEAGTGEFHQCCRVFSVSSEKLFTLDINRPKAQILTLLDAYCKMLVFNLCMNTKL